MFSAREYRKIYLNIFEYHTCKKNCYAFNINLKNCKHRNMSRYAGDLKE